MFRPSFEHPIDCLDFSPDGHLIASGTFDSPSLKIWNWRDGSRKTLEGVEEWGINDICFSPDGQYIAAGMEGPDGVLIWNVRTGQLVGKLLKNREVKSVAFTPDGMGLVSGTCDDVRLWDSSLFKMDGSGSQLRNGRMEVDNNTGKELLNFRKYQVCVAFAFKYLYKPISFFFPSSLMLALSPSRPTAVGWSLARRIMAYVSGILTTLSCIVR